MLKIYRLPNGRTYQFEEGKAPAGAKLVEPAIMPEPEEKKAEPKNKAKTTKNKSK